MLTWSTLHPARSRALLAIACATGCSGDGGDLWAESGGSAGTIDVGQGGGFSGSGGAPGGGGGSSGYGNVSGNGGQPTLSDCRLQDETGCVGATYEGENVPLDIYVMFDQSGSMLNDVGGLTRLAAVQRATERFLRDPASAGIRVGIGYFGYQTIGQASCEDADYATPDVPVTDDHERVIDSLYAREPTGETPTGSAIRGACEYTRSYKLANPGRAVVQLLVTDGKPEAPVTCPTGACCPTLPDAVSAADECRNGSPEIRTYVLGVGPLLDSLAQIAVAGGTERAYLVGDENVTDNVLAALAAIRANAAIPCQIEIPPPAPGQTVDYERVNVAYADASCDAEFVLYVASPAACDPVAGGWHYDDPASPTSVRLCPTTCDRVSEPGGHLLVALGCRTKVPIE